MGWLNGMLEFLRGKRRGAAMDARHQLGLRGEEIAEQFLRQRGLSCIARRYSGPMGELDLVMDEKRTIVFVEVKTQTSAAFNDPHERVTPAKQRKLIRVAKAFLIDKRLTDRPCRFDVVSVTTTDAQPRIQHFVDAFRPLDEGR